VQLWRQGRVRAVERIASPAEADVRVLDHLASLGCDPAQPRECRHYFYVPAGPGAHAVARTLNARDGWDAEVEEVRDAWLVTATTVTRLDHQLVRTTRRGMEELASHHGGAYDGWEAAAD
jgi:hypothetical protein